MKPGEYILASEEIELNQGRKTIEITVANTGDRPVQVGSHFHFFEVNKALKFDRSQAFGMRLNIPAGMAVRFEPGEEKEVSIVEFGGEKTVYGLNNLTDGSLRAPAQLSKSMAKAFQEGYKGVVSGPVGVKSGSKEGNEA